MTDIRKILTESNICQYCLNLGRGVTYPGESSENIMTTENELERAESAHVDARYINQDTIDFYMYHPRPYQIAEAITNAYDSCELDEWQAVQDVFRIELSYKDSKKITDLLWDKENSTSPRDFVDKFMGAETAKATLNKVKPETKAKILSIFAEIGIDYIKYIEHDTVDVKGV